MSISKVLNERTLIIASAVVLFAATILGWVKHMHHDAVKPTKMSQGSKQLPAATTTATATNNQPAPGGQESTEIAQATRLLDIILKARQSAGRPDPMAPIGAVSAPRHRVAATPMQVPPPPSESVGLPSMEAPAAPPRVVHAAPVAYDNAVGSTPLLQAVRLVGLIDNKAIFAVPHSVAERQHVPRSFILGKGESFHNLHLEEVTQSGVTIRNGSRVATKELDSIH